MPTRSSCPARASCLALLVLLGATAHAAPPSLRYSWDECEPLVLNRDFAGPGHYSQTLSVVGLEQPLTSFQASIAIAVSQPSAWQFYDFGCQGASRLSATTAALGCLSVPGLEVSVSMYPGLTDFRLHLTLSGTAAGGAAPDPAARYALARLDFDHTHTTTGFGDPPGQCGNGDWGQCFGIEYFSLNGSSVTIENGTLTWNLSSTPGQCPFPVAARASTWGRLKALYR